MAGRFRSIGIGTGPFCLRDLLETSTMVCFGRVPWRSQQGRIINLLRPEPRNVNQLAEALDVHYRVAEHHIRSLEKNHLVTSGGGHYGKLYFLSQEMEAHLYLFDEIWQKIRPVAGEVKK